MRGKSSTSRHGEGEHAFGGTCLREYTSSSPLSMSWLAASVRRLKSALAAAISAGVAAWAPAG